VAYSGRRAHRRSGDGVGARRPSASGSRSRLRSRLDIKNACRDLGSLASRQSGSGRQCQDQPGDKDDLAPGGEDKVRLAGQTRAVEAEAIAEAVGEGADEAFSRGALVPDAGHTFGALGWG
jgi:hypothetical protein